MIKRAYDPTARILYDIMHDLEFLKVKVFTNDRDRLYQAVRNDYYIHTHCEDRIDFFYDSIYYEKLITDLVIEIQLGSGMAEQNMILYNVNKILDSVNDSLMNYKNNNRPLMNIGFLGIDLSKQQLFLTDIENKYDVCFQLMLDRDLNQLYGMSSGLQYHIRFRYLKREYEETI